MQKAPLGDMLSISISEAELKPLLTVHKRISLSVVNSTELCVVSGTKKLILEFKLKLDKLGYKSKPVRTSHAFHSHMMDGVMTDFGKEFRKVKTKEIQIPFISNLSGKPVDKNQISTPQYWMDHLRKTVNFSKGIGYILKTKNVILIEVGPGKSLSASVKSNQSRIRDHHVINLVRSYKDIGNDLTYLLSGLGKIWELGITPDWNAYYENESRRKVSLPTYSFEKVKYPVIVDATKMITEMISNGSDDKKQAINEWFYAPTWKFDQFTKEYSSH